MKKELFDVSRLPFWGAGMALVAAFAFAGFSACRTRSFGTLPASGASAPFNANALEAFYKEFPAGATHDVDASFEATVQFDTTRPACDRHFARLDPQGLILPEHAASAQARADLLLCGKHLFFHFPMPTELGIPTNVVKSLAELFPEEMGPSFSKVGLRPNPRDPGFPMEMPVTTMSRKGVKSTLTGEARVLTCAACHVGKLPDGRYAVGMPNEDLDLGKFNALLIYPLWLADAGENRKDPKKWDPTLATFYEKLFRKSGGKFLMSRVPLDGAALLGDIGVGGFLYALIGQEPPPVVDQRGFLKGLRGSYNPATPLLSDDRHELYSTPPSLWGLSHRGESATQTREAYLGTVTSAHSLEDFARQAIVYTTMEPANVQKRYVDALVAYMRSLAPVPSAAPKKEALFAQGAALYGERCTTCHDGHNGASTQYIDLAKVNGPRVYQEFLVDAPRANRQTKAIFKALAGTKPIALDHKRAGVKARRLTGLWARNRLGTNGMVPGLDGLLCLNGVARPTEGKGGPLSATVHEELCSENTEPERQALKEYLVHFPTESEAGN